MVKWSCSVVSDSAPHGLQPTRLPRPWDFPGKNAGVSCRFLLQVSFPIQGLNLGLLHWPGTLYRVRRFTVWATRELEWWKMWLNILRWGVSWDYAGRANVITRVLMKETDKEIWHRQKRRHTHAHTHAHTHTHAHRRREVKMQKRSYVATAKGCQQPAEAGRAGAGCHQASGGGVGLADALMLAWGTAFLTVGL